MQTQKIITEYIGKAFLPPEEARYLQPDTPLFSSGVIDSIGIIKLIYYIEKTFNIEFLPRELDTEHLETIEAIVSLVESKIKHSE